jgi:chemotaxis protein histidine kinase CheA
MGASKAEAAAAAAAGLPPALQPPRVPALVDEYLPRVLEDIERLDAELDRELAGLFGGLAEEEEDDDDDGSGGGGAGAGRGDLGEEGGMAMGPMPTPAQQEAQAAAAHKAISDVRGGGGLRQLQRPPPEQEEEEEEEEVEEEEGVAQQRAWERQSRLMAAMEREVIKERVGAEERGFGGETEDEEEREGGRFRPTRRRGSSSRAYRMQEEEEAEEKEEVVEQEEEGYLFMASTERIYEGPALRSKRQRPAAMAAPAAAAVKAPRMSFSLLSLDDDEEEEEAEAEAERRREAEERRACKARRAAVAEKKRLRQRQRREQQQKQRQRKEKRTLVRDEEEEEEEEEVEEAVRPAAATTYTAAARALTTTAALPPLGVWGTAATAASAFGWACLAVRLLQKEGGLRSALHYLLHPFHAVGSLTLPPALAFAQAGRAHLRLLKHQPLTHRHLGPFHRALLRAAVVASAVYAAVGLAAMTQARPLAALVALLSLSLVQAAPHLLLLPTPSESGERERDSSGVNGRRPALALGAGGLLWALLTVGLPFSLTDTPAPVSLVGGTLAALPPAQSRTLRRVACLGLAAGMGQMAAICFRDAQALEGGLVTGGERRATGRVAKVLAVGSSLSLMGAGMGPLVVAAAVGHAALLAWLLGTGADGGLARALAELQGAGVLAAVLVGEAGLLFPQSQQEAGFATAVKELLRVSGQGGAGKEEEEDGEQEQEQQMQQQMQQQSEAASASVVVPEPESPRAPDAPPARPSKQPQRPLELPVE